MCICGCVRIYEYLCSDMLGSMLFILSIISAQICSCPNTAKALVRAHTHTHTHTFSHERCLDNPPTSQIDTPLQARVSLPPDLLTTSSVLQLELWLGHACLCSGPVLMMPESKRRLAEVRGPLWPAISY